MRKALFFKCLCLFLSLCLAAPVSGWASVFSMSDVSVSAPVLVSPLLKGLQLTPQDPFHFDFIIDAKNLENKQQAEKLVKYFLSALTIPEEDLWVNLNPDEPDRIVPEAFGRTQMGRDLLAQDYILKKLTASLMRPEGEWGRKFWSQIYRNVYEQAGAADVPADFMSRVWIVPQKAVIYENGDMGYVADAKMKVMLEEEHWAGTQEDVSKQPADKNLPTETIKSIIIPAIEHEVNYGAQFAPLRQIYHALILSAWYKRKLKDGLLKRYYAGQKKISGAEFPKDVAGPEDVYERYLKAFKGGIFQHIQEEYDPVDHSLAARKYVCGGASMSVDHALQSVNILPAFTRLPRDSAMLSFDIQPVFRNQDSAIVSEDQAWEGFLDFATNYEGNIAYIAGGFDTESFESLMEYFFRVKEFTIVDPLIKKESSLLIKEDLSGNLQLDLLAQRIQKLMRDKNKDARIDVVKIDFKRKEIFFDVFNKRLGSKYRIQYMVKSFYDVKEKFGVVYINSPGLGGSFAREGAFWEGVKERLREKGQLLVADKATALPSSELFMEKEIVPDFRSSARGYKIHVYQTNEDQAMTVNPKWQRLYDYLMSQVQEGEYRGKQVEDIQKALNILRSYEHIIIEAAPGHGKAAYRLAEEKKNWGVIGIDLYKENDGYGYGDLWKKGNLSSQNNPLENLALIKGNILDVVKFFPKASVDGFAMFTPDRNILRDLLMKKGKDFLRMLKPDAECFVLPYYAHQEDRFVLEMTGFKEIDNEKIFGVNFGVNARDVSINNVGAKPPMHITKKILEENLNAQDFFNPSGIDEAMRTDDKSELITYEERIDESGQLEEVIIQCPQGELKLVNEGEGRDYSFEVFLNGEEIGDDEENSFHFYEVFRKNKPSYIRLSGFFLKERGRGIGWLLLEYLKERANRQGIRGFEGEGSPNPDVIYMYLSGMLVRDSVEIDIVSLGNREDSFLDQGGDFSRMLYLTGGINVLIQDGLLGEGRRFAEIIFDSAGRIIRFQENRTQENWTLTRIDKDKDFKNARYKVSKEAQEFMLQVVEGVKVRVTDKDGKRYPTQYRKADVKLYGVFQEPQGIRKVEVEQAEVIDHAIVSKKDGVGGIDLSHTEQDVDIQKYTPEESLFFEWEGFDPENFLGFRPVHITIAPIMNLPELLGIH